MSTDAVWNAYRSGRVAWGPSLAGEAGPRLGGASGEGYGDYGFYMASGGSGGRVADWDARRPWMPSGHDDKGRDKGVN